MTGHAVVEQVAGTFEIRARGPFSFRASVRFLEGFAPAAYDRADRAGLRLAFPADGTWETAGAWIVPMDDDAGVIIETTGGGDAERVRDQVARILSLDVDGTGYDGVIDRDPVLRSLWVRYEGLRPVLFHSPYEAAAWAIIGNRIRITQAARIKTRMADDLGDQLVIAGEPVAAFPAPERLSCLEGFPGLSERKIGFLRSLGDAATAGHLALESLRSLSPEAARQHLKELPGIGDFSAELIMIRAVGEIDRVPVTESRCAGAVQRFYELDHEPDPDQNRAISDRWQPFRSWVSVMLRAALEDAATHEIGGKMRSS
ncbi:MAG: DNA-3-methyladenine glycosylase 2 family protein [Chloroflexota bacterium]|nr:DNA-3-methyladenine glycosylase 2 family protein [Chloroflexota bacterium]